MKKILEFIKKEMKEKILLKAFVILGVLIFFNAIVNFLN